MFKDKNCKTVHKNTDTLVDKLLNPSQKDQQKGKKLYTNYLISILPY